MLPTKQSELKWLMQNLENTTRKVKAQDSHQLAQHFSNRIGKPPTNSLIDHKQLGISYYIFAVTSVGLLLLSHWYWIYR